VWFVIRHISTRSLPPAFGIFLLGTAPTALRHWIAMGSPFAYESFIMHREPFEHSLLGIKFGLKTLLNYPFHSEIVRTPFNPYPTFLMWPLYLARYSGFAACVITALGLFNCRRENRQMLTFAVIWLAPMFILLSLLENWDFPSKMNIVLVMFNGFYLLFALGLDSMAHLRLDFRSLLRPAAVSFLVPSAILAVNAIPAGMFPADARYIERNSCVRKENARYLENERNWIGSAGILPFGDLTDIIGRVINPPLIETPRLWNDTAGWHSDEAIKWMNAARQADGDEASFFLDIRQEKANHEAWISKQAVSVLQDEIVVFEGDSMTLEELAVDWSERPLRIEIAYSKEKRIIRISISTCRIEWFDVYCAGCMEVRQRDYNIPGRMGNADNKHPDEKSANFAGQKRKSGILIKAGIPVWVVLEDHVNPGADVIYSIEGLLDLDGFHPVLTGRRVTN
ncbi:MAG: hypothetical protein FJ088_05880, partial [Deltaproteobacteria bacterium]|nr:hypothetical protein [Deltaproteobacteria bacterium]